MAVLHRKQGLLCDKKKKKKIATIQNCIKRQKLAYRSSTKVSNDYNEIIKSWVPCEGKRKKKRSSSNASGRQSESELVFQRGNNMTVSRN